MRFFIPFILILAGCGSLHENYVKQDRNNYETLWPLVEEMLETAPYDTVKKLDIKDRGMAWDLWTSEALEAIKKEAADE